MNKEDQAAKNLSDLREWQALPPFYAMNIEMHGAKCPLIGE